MSNPQTVEPTMQALEQEDTLNKLADYVMSLERSATGWYGATTKLSETFNVSDVPETIAGILYFIENAFSAMTITGKEDRKS